MKNKLYIAATRGAKTYGGVPALGFGANFLVAYFGYMVFGDADFLHVKGYYWIIQFVFIHFAMREMVDYDPNIFRIIEASADSLSLRTILWAAPPYFPRKARDLDSVL